jgi:hypothetical protein
MELFQVYYLKIHILIFCAPIRNLHFSIVSLTMVLYHIPVQQVKYVSLIPSMMNNIGP